MKRAREQSRIYLSIVLITDQKSNVAILGEFVRIRKQGMMYIIHALRGRSLTCQSARSTAVVRFESLSDRPIAINRSCREER